MISLNNIPKQELYSTLYAMDSSLRGYGFRDAYEFFKKFLNILHEDFKFIGKKQFDMKKHCPAMTDFQEEWDVM